MAQHRSRESDSRGGGHAASQVSVLLRMGRAAREGLSRAANDNYARVWTRTGGAILVAVALGVFGYAVLRWIV